MTGLLHLAVVGGLLLVTSSAWAQDLESQLREIDSTTLAARARLRGNPKQGALVFFKSAAACSQCHEPSGKSLPLGPRLTELGKDLSDEYVVDAILRPSKTIRKGFETVSILTDDGRIHVGLVQSKSEDQIVLRDANNITEETKIDRATIEEMAQTEKSLMPDGLVASLRSEKEFYDLVRYVSEVAHGGTERAAQLRPSAEELLVKDDSIGLDHAGILGSLTEADLRAGRNIYMGHCINCHGEDGNTPKLPTARAFGKDKLKFGADPYSMFLTLTRGAGLMAPMQHLSPRERYQVIGFIRASLMKDRNPEYQEVTPDYLAGLPQGTESGERGESGERDFGPVLGSQIGTHVNNALTFRLNDQISVGYDLHRMQLAGVWKGGFLDLAQTQHYRQRGEQMPQIQGDILYGLTDWQWALADSFEISPDDKPARGPVRTNLATYHGHYLYGDQAILSYSIGGREVLETITGEEAGTLATVAHSLRIEPGDRPLKLSIGRLEMLPAPGVKIPHLLTSPATVDANPHGLGVIYGKPDVQRRPPSMDNDPLLVVAGDEAKKLDLGTPGRTIVAHFKTDQEGTLIASAPREGKWTPDGKSLFVRGKRLVFDIGWVGALVSKSQVADNQWHVATVVVDKEQTQLYVDGKLEASRPKFRRPAVKDHVLKIGATATNFGGDYVGEIGWVQILDGALTADQVSAFMPDAKPQQDGSLFLWEPPAIDSPTARHADSNNSKAKLQGVLVAAAVTGDTAGLSWQRSDDGRAVLTIPVDDRPRLLRIVRASCETLTNLKHFEAYTTALAKDEPVVDLKQWTHGGPTRWPQVLEVTGQLGEPINGYALDTIPIPFENPWNAWIRTSALDFFDDGRAVVTTHGGDVYLVSGIDQSLGKVTWKRFAAGLFEPFGVRVIDGTIYVTCRDGLKRLHDFDGNGEADFVEAFWNDDDVSSMFHAYNFDLQTDSAGNFYFAKAGQYTQHHRPGTIMRIPPEGGSAEVVAWGLRTPNGMGKLKDDRFTVSDNQGPWMPAGKISLVRPDSFMGNMPINDEQRQWLAAKHGGKLPETFDEPIIWMPQELDSSCGGQVWVDDPRFGPLSGRLIHSSFGKGWLYYLSLQEIGETMQASIVALPHQWDAGVMRLRVNPHDGQLYGTGLSGWQGPAGGKDGCLQRLRYTGEPVAIVDDFQVTPDGVELKFSFEVDPASAADAQSWSAEMWNYLWSARYGSDQFSVRRPQQHGHDPLTIESVEIVDPKTVRLHIPGLEVCDQLRLEMRLKDAAGKLFTEELFATVHQIPKKS
ncbi:DUF6797 domain-containing protein [Blastopirellula marina]|uniref:Cytochrome c domain-containing protein n=1 Tax=Blastopirellula marina TaxID=124 RepID=A0A2S8GBT0_9BACT|nr:DUF6797 domain-containing protein [Blastopirellula marina]PQO41916.1 hypothetical protein C5Y98_02445 [Blastopirellula marina]PTL46274.1 hypothetical protein C5Y97_02445 [Blastopirellula marina]